MAYPGSPPKGSGLLESAPLTPDDFERLATAFRPSWELDEAPFSGAGSLSPSDIRALQGGGTHADVRATALTAAHATHAPAKPVVGAEEPASKVIVAPDSVRPPPPAAERPVVLQSPGPWAAASAAAVAPAPGSMRPVAPAMGSVRPPAPGPLAAPVPSVAARSPSMPPLRPSLGTDPGLSDLKKPNTKLYAALGGAVVVIGAIIWLASGSSDKDKPAPIPAVAETVAEKPHPSIPPPPPEDTVAAAAAAPAAPPAAVAPSRPVMTQPQSAAAPPPVVAATALPQAPAVVAQRAAPPPAPAPHPAAAPPPPAPKPATASRGKGPTIVRDVPF